MYFVQYANKLPASGTGANFPATNSSSETNFVVVG